MNFAQRRAVRRLKVITGAEPQVEENPDTDSFRGIYGFEPRPDDILVNLPECRCVFDSNGELKLMLPNIKRIP